ncbi:MAG: prolyl oligopeptidase family serine peptidase [Phycisphaerae bacterium]|nr:prolyl oligopeptidase family serine peptidase [Tepidisphaeraceae bacterium]
MNRLLGAALILLSLPALAQDPRVYRESVDPHWSADRASFWYRNDNPGNRREFILVDAKAGTRTPAFDHAKVAEALAKLLKRPVTADALPIDSIEMGAQSILRGRTQSWQWDPATTMLTPAPAPAIDAATLAPLDRPRPSRNGGGETSIRFVNKTPGPLDAAWVNTDGTRRKYATVAAGATHDQHTFAGHIWVLTDPAGKVVAAFQATEHPASAVVGGNPPARVDPQQLAGPARQRTPRRAQSPDGQFTLVGRDANLFLRPRDDGPEIVLSTDGKPADAYSADRAWWSPDSKYVVALRTEPAQEHKVYIVESTPKDQFQPALKTLDYLKPGDRISRPRVVLFDVATRKPIPVKDDLFPTPWSINDVRWSADSSRFTFVYNQRGHQVLRVIAVDAKTGDAKTIVDEQSKTFIHYSGKFFCHWLGDDELIWASERDGWNHLYLIDARTQSRGLGTSVPESPAQKSPRQITKGPWVVRNIVHVDPQKLQIWFMAGGIRPGHDPYYMHFARADLDGGNITILTEGDGNHAVKWQPGDAYFIDTFSRVDLPPVHELRSASDGRLVTKLEEADATDLLAARGGRWPERFSAKGRDGKTDIHGVIVLPRNFDPKATYPVVEQIYAGPQGFFTPKAFRRSFGTMQRLADMGMIVVQCDGMGTDGRGKAFHDVCYKNLKDGGFPDRVAWIKAAAAKFPQMDLSRVGIYGGSAGGQNAMAALLWHNDFYKVAVADCGCHDNRMDKIWWNEQWMGWPVDKSYEASSNAVNAHLLKGKLLLMWGELDTNVDPASSMQVVAALQKVNKDFEHCVIAGAGHGAAETPYGSRKRAEFLARNLGVK